MTSDEPPRESEPNRNVEQGEPGHQTRPNLSSEAAGKAEIVFRKRSICPYLGVSDDRTVVSTQPTPAHVCFARRQRYLPSLEHQKARCLGTHYPGCSLYPDKKPDKVTNDKLYGLQGKLSKDRRGRRRWLGWIGLALLVLVGALAYAVANGLLPLPLLQLAFSPTPVATVAVSGVAPTIVSVITETPTETSVPTLRLTPPDSTAMAQGAEPTARNTPSPTVATPASTQTPTSMPTRTPTETSVPAPTITPDAPSTPVAQSAESTQNTPRPTVVTPAISESATETPTKIPTSTSTTAPTRTATEIPTEPSTETPTETSMPTLTLTPNPTPTAVAQGAESTPRNTPGLVTVTPEKAEVVTISPNRADAGWWASAPTQPGQFGDSFLYAGVYEAQAYISAIRFDLRRVPRGARIESAVVRLTGLRDDLLDRSTNNSWVVQLISESALPELADVSFFTLYEAPVSFQLAPDVETEDVGVGVVNEWMLDSATRGWLSQQLLDGATSVVVRIIPLENSGDALFAWDSGYGTESSGAAPELVLNLGPTPPLPASP